MPICRLPRVAARKRRPKPPLCKGRWIAARRDGGIACGRLCCHELRSAEGGNPSAPAGQLPLHKGAFVFAAARMGSLRQSEPQQGGRPMVAPTKMLISTQPKGSPFGGAPASAGERVRASADAPSCGSPNPQQGGLPRNRKALPPGELSPKVTERARVSVGS